MINKNRGKLIIFEGIDRCGKSTQTKLLWNYFNEKNIKCKLLNFPKRDTESGKMINNYLKGNTKVDKEFVHKLFSVNRWELKNEIIEAINNNYNVIIDRYSYSGVVYSMANGLEKNWCKISEIGLPKPDILFYLNIDIEEAKLRSDFGNEVYEKESFQRQVKENYENNFIYLESNIYEIKVNKKDKNEVLEEITKIIDNFKIKNDLEVLWKDLL